MELECYIVEDTDDDLVQNDDDDGEKHDDDDAKKKDTSVVDSDMLLPYHLMI